MSTPSDEQLRAAIDAVFSKYDKDNSKTLTRDEVRLLITDAYKNIKSNKQVSEADVEKFINAVDVNKDNQITKPELFEIFKRIISAGH